METRFCTELHTPTLSSHVQMYEYTYKYNVHLCDSIQKHRDSDATEIHCIVLGKQLFQSQIPQVQCLYKGGGYRKYGRQIAE